MWLFFFSSRRRHTSSYGDWSSDVCSSDLPVDAEVVAVHATDLPLQLLVAHPPRCGPPAFDGIVSRGGNLQRLADRLDPESITMRVDIAGHFGSRGSSSRAKKAEAVFKISLARRSSRFSFSSSTIRCRSAVVTPGRRPWSTSAFLTQCRNVSEPIPSSRPTRVTTPWRSPVSLMVSSTILTARSRISGGYWCRDLCFDDGGFDADMGYILPKNEASIKPRAIQSFELHLNSDMALWRVSRRA